MNEFSKLLEQQIPRLRRYAFALHRSNKSRADDLVQDTLVRALAKSVFDSASRRAARKSLISRKRIGNLT
jgi:DNA-directed RNA polymerase specialized sigma24 family protein